MTIEEALGVEGLTIAASFVGEAYMSGGFIAVFLAGLFFGAITSWWDYLSSDRNSQLGILVYSSGFFAAVISMRSLFVFSTAILPTVAAVVAGSVVVHLARTAIQKRQMLSKHIHTGPASPPEKKAQPRVYGP